MKPGRKIKLIIPALVVLALGVIILFVALNLPGGRKTNIIKILPDEADISIQNFVFTEVGKDNIRWEVRSDSAQYEKQDLAVFDKVRVKLTMPDGKVIVMTGDKGEMLTDKKDLEIKGHVQIIADSGEKFSTDYLKYSDSEKKIYTGAPVVMESERVRIQGTGLEIFIQKGELILSSVVRQNSLNRDVMKLKVICFSIYRSLLQMFLCRQTFCRQTNRRHNEPIEIVSNKMEAF